MSLPRITAVSERPLADTLAAAVLATVHFMMATRLVEALDPWSSVGPDDRQLIFQTGAGVVAIVAALTAVGMAVGGTGERARAVRLLYGRELRRNWRALVYVSALAPAVVLAAQVAEGNSASWAPYLFEFAVLWTVLRLVRLAWLTQRLMEAEDLDLAEVPRSPAAPLSEDFQRRMAAS